MQDNFESTIQSGVFQQAYNQREWIYNEYFELMFIAQGTGQRIVGDRIDHFESGDLVFLGKHLPHIWVSDPIRIDQTTDRYVESIYIHFNPDLLKGHLFELPEFYHVQEAIKKSNRGCLILGDSRNKISEWMMQVPYLEGFDQMVNMLTILNEIGKSQDIIYLTSDDYLSTQTYGASKRIQKIIEYFMKNYQSPLNLNDLADLMNMQSASLCRFFKKETNLIFTKYLNLLMFVLAEKMLMNKKLHNEEIAYECGYNTISFFNRQFKKYKQMSPTVYRKRFNLIVV